MVRSEAVHFSPAWESHRRRRDRRSVDRSSVESERRWTERSPAAPGWEAVAGDCGLRAKVLAASTSEPGEGEEPKHDELEHFLEVAGNSRNPR